MAGGPDWPATGQGACEPCPAEIGSTRSPACYRERSSPCSGTATSSTAAGRGLAGLFSRLRPSGFSGGSTTYAVQFHLEVTSEMAAEWAAVPAYARALEHVLGAGALDRLLADFAAARAGMQGHARALFEAWWRRTTLAGVANPRTGNDQARLPG